MPAGGEWPSFGLAVTDNAGADQVGIVVGGAVRVRDSVPEFPALVYGAWCFWGHVARNAARERELREEALHTLLICGDVRVHLAARDPEGRGCHQPRAAMSGACDIDHVKIVLLDYPVQVNVDKVQAWGG